MYLDISNGDTLFGSDVVTDDVNDWQRVALGCLYNGTAKSAAVHASAQQSHGTSRHDFGRRSVRSPQIAITQNAFLHHRMLRRRDLTRHRRG
jgi:hypothetical protein